VQIALEAVLDAGAVDLRDEPALRGEAGAVGPGTIADRGELLQGLPRMPATPTANVEPELVLDRSQASLQRAEDAGRDAARMSFSAAAAAGP
jgi:hypothetical protein